MPKQVVSLLGGGRPGKAIQEEGTKRAKGYRGPQKGMDMEAGQPCVKQCNGQVSDDDDVKLLRRSNRGRRE